MPTKLIENKLTEAGLKDFAKGFASGLGSGIAKQFGINIPDAKQKYEKATGWLKKYNMVDSNIPGVDAVVLSARVNELIIDIVMGQNDSDVIYIKVQDIVCPFKTITKFFPKWDKSDDEFLQDYASMAKFYSSHEGDAKYTDKDRKKYKFLNTESSNFDIMLWVFQKYNIPFYNPKKFNMSAGEYNKAMLTSENGDISNNKKCNDFLATYLFMSLFVQMRTLDDVLDFGEAIGAKEVNTTVTDPDVINGMLKKVKGDTKGEEYQELAQKQRIKVALLDIVKQIFRT